MPLHVSRLDPGQSPSPGSLAAGIYFRHKRESMSDRQLFRFGKYELDRKSRELRKNGVRLKLDDQPFRLLEELLVRNQELVSREELRHVLWPDGIYVDFDRSLTRAVNKLRLALADDAANPRFVETIPRRGYRFNAPVSMVIAPDSADLLGVQPAEPDSPDELLSGVQLSLPAHSRSRLLVWSLCGIMLVAGSTWYGLHGKSKAQASAAVKQSARDKAADGVTVSPDEATQALYTKGRFLTSESGRESIERGIRILEKVIEKEPQYAPAHAALAEGWFGLASVYLPPLETMPKARAAARNAIRLDPGSVDGHAVLGRVHVFYDWDWTGAEEEFQRALALNPNSANALKGRACLRIVQGRSSDALRDIDAALRIDPRSLWLHFMAVAFRANARQYDGALKQARTSLEWEPRFGMLRSFAGVISAMNGNRNEALHELEDGVRQQTVPTSMGFLALGNGIAGRRMQAQRALNDLVALTRKQYVCPFEIACAYASLHRNDEAYKWLSKSVSERADCLIWLRAEPWLDPIRNDPRYKTLVQQVSFP